MMVLTVEWSHCKNQKIIKTQNRNINVSYNHFIKAFKIYEEIDNLMMQKI